MADSLPTSMLQLRSRVDADGTLTLTVDEVDLPTPGPNEVLIRVEAAPINPSDLGLLLAGADPATLTVGDGANDRAVSGPIPAGAVEGLRTRLGLAMPVGNEGAGTVVAAGDSPEAQALIGRVVGAAGGSMYAQYRNVALSLCIPMPDGITAVQAASPFVNPMTVLCMIETMRAEGHSAIVHTAAASNLGQMLVKACAADGIPLVNIVRRAEHAEVLRALGAEHVVDSSRDSYAADLTAAISATGATLGFDATGGGRLASDILAAMERSLAASETTFNRYGSSTHKQVYIYGGLDRGVTTINRSFGMAWGVGGWLLTPRLMQFGWETVGRLRERVANEITTTFASSYSDEVSLRGALDPLAIARYAQQATGTKYLIRPHD